MNYKDFGEGRKIDGKKLLEMMKASRAKELSEIASRWNFFSNDVLVGLICLDRKFSMLHRGLGGYPLTQDIDYGDLIAPVNRTLIKRRPSGLYLIEGVKLGLIEEPNYNFPISQLVLPTDKFMPLYVNMYQDAGVMIPPMEFGRVD